MDKSPGQFPRRAAWRVAALLAAVLAGLGPLVGLLSPAHADPVHVQEAANNAALKGTWVMVDYQGSSPVLDILRKVNTTAQDYGIPDTNGDPNDVINDNVLAYYVYFDGSCVPLVGGPGGCWELHCGPNLIPAGARGLRLDVTLPITSASVDLAGTMSVVTATATAVWTPDGGILPIAVNEYWLGSEGRCPYANCGEPYSFVRDPAELPPFQLVSSSPEVWARNTCPNPYNNNVCQGPYDGYSENFGRAFALMGADAKPNYNSVNPRGAVEVDYRYNALEDGGSWHFLVADDTWQHNIPPIAEGAGRDAMAEVILQGGYVKSPLPMSLYEQPIDYIGQWGYCWALPHNEDNCFNWPATGRSEPYDVLQFLNSASGAFLAQVMYDDGAYVEGRYAPGERIVVMVYNSFPGGGWGSGGNTADAAVIVGYAGAVIVGYGNAFASPCNGTPGDWQSYVPCVQGAVNTVYGIISPEIPLVLDPVRLVYEWLPKTVGLITPTVALPVAAGVPGQSNQLPSPLPWPAPLDLAMDAPYTRSLPWRGGPTGRR